MSEAALLAGDWGTTNLRVWALDAAGAVLARREFPFGVAGLAKGEAARRLREVVRPGFSPATLPVLLCGMAGSNLGVAPAPYLDCPARLEDLAGGLILAGEGVWIAPGLRCQGLTGAPDVMRGEETQILGLLSMLGDQGRGRHLICLPGTHAKWVQAEGGQVIRFATAMTGELYAVLRDHSVLCGPDVVEDPAAFDEGLAAAGDGGALAARLFSTRARVVGGGAPASSAASYLSGLLIGAEVAALPGLLGEASTPVSLVGAGALCGLYGRALTRLGIDYNSFDGEAAALAGLYALWSAT
jgi:2-dehydro-3-deoxygalactonokinase